MRPVVQGTIVQPAQQVVTPSRTYVGTGQVVDDDAALAAALAESERMEAERRKQRREQERHDRLQVEVALKTSRGQRSGSWGSPRPVQGAQPDDMTAALEASRASQQRRARIEAKERAQVEAALRASIESAPAQSTPSAPDPLDVVAAAHNLTSAALREFCAFFDVDPDRSSVRVVTAVAKGATAPLPPGWSEATDPATGRTYYVAPNKKGVSWAHPADAETREALKALQAELLPSVRSLSELEPEPEPHGVVSTPTNDNDNAAAPVESGQEPARSSASVAPDRSQLVTQFESQMLALEAAVADCVSKNVVAANDPAIAQMEKNARSIMGQIKAIDSQRQLCSTVPKQDGFGVGRSSRLASTAAAGLSDTSSAPTASLVAHVQPTATRRRKTMQSTFTPSSAQPRRKYLVKEKATIREGREKSSRKIGELRKGMVVHAVEEGVTDSQGLRLVLLQPPESAVDTATALYPAGGWVKLVTSKGKVLLAELRKEAAARAALDEAAEVEEAGRSTDV